MSASWNNPALINKISDDVPEIKNLLIALLKMTDSNTEDVPVDAKRLYDVSGGVQFQKYTGTAWANIGKLMHDIDMLDGKHATSSATADTIPVRDANGRLAGDILGNAATASVASDLASGYIVPVSKGGTGASDEAGARTNLGTNNAANITTGVLAVANGGTGSGTQNFVDLSTAQTIGGDKKFSGKVILNKNVLQMIVLDTTEGATAERTDTIIQGISPNDGNGINTLFGSSGGTILGAGEGKGSLLAELAGQGAENVHLIADSNIYFHVNSQTYANKKTITLNTSAELSGLAKVTATTFAGKVQLTPAGGTYVAAATNGNAIVNATTSGYGAVFNAPTKNYRVALSTYPSSNDEVLLYSVTNANISAGTNTVAKSLKWDAGTGTLTANAFVGVFPAGTRMLFQQSAAPTGWTKETGSGYNNTALRFVTGNVANYTSGYAFTTCMANGRTSTSTTQGGTIANATQGGSLSKTKAGGTNANATQGGTVGNKALSVAMLASHSHKDPGWEYGSGAGNHIMYTVNHAKNSRFSTDATGSGSNHNHSFTGSAHTHTFTGTEHTHTFTGSAHSHTFTGSGHTHQLHMNVNYIDCIIAAKA